MNITNISKSETAVKENVELINTNIDTDLYEFKNEASISINKTVSTINTNNPPSSYNQPSAYIIKWELTRSPDFHFHASQITKHLSPMTLEGDTLLQI